MLGQFRSTRGGFTPKAFWAQVVGVGGGHIVTHAINLVSVCAVKSTMGTTRA